MKSVRILSAFAVIAAAGMIPAGCESPAGAGNGYDGAASAEVSAPVSVSAGGTTAISASGTKTIRVKFEVLNGGLGIDWSEGIAGTQDNSRLIYGRGWMSRDYTITIIAPAYDEYLNIYWSCAPMTGISHNYYYCKAKTKAESGTITLDHNGWKNGKPQLAAKNLYDVELLWDNDNTNHDGQYGKWWEDLKKRAGRNEFEGGRTIKVKFEVKNGGWGLWKSEGIVSTQDDISYLVYDHEDFANDYTITIPVPEDDEYLNVRWRGWDGAAGETHVRAKMKAESGTITLDYNGHRKVATKNLYDVATGDHYDKKDPLYGFSLGPDWDDAKNRSDIDPEEFL